MYFVVLVVPFDFFQAIWCCDAMFDEIKPKLSSLQTRVTALGRFL